jgi:hypothetical protein
MLSFAPGKIEDVAHDHVFAGVARTHPIRGMNRLGVKTLEVNRVRALNSDLGRIDVAAHRTDQTEILVLMITGRTKSERESAAARRHFQTRAFQTRGLNTACSFGVTFVHEKDQQ